MDYHKWAPGQTDSGLIPPKSSNAWPERSVAAANKPIWQDPDPVKPEPTPPTREEKLALARQEATACLSDPAAENALLAQILRAKHNISAEDASRAVQEAQAEIERGAQEDV